ncbi:DUF2631 domain-containing protein [Corynebacterium mendelii]|uniref:DUF2631 domain-containing protein n=1 Tax=Corynebacterium mendelii TaxID=2765362 RepID=A0A939IWB5_9CORY|nr:DUF2631 domain-containing protein [Corynebacterium mendelii]
MGSHSKEDQAYKGVSTADEPSAAWGWHRIGKGPTTIAAVVSALFLLAMNFGNHHGHVETIYLTVFAVAILAMVGLWHVHPHFKTKTTITGHNKPVGHQEPNWALDQATFSGAYAELTDEELIAWNIDPEVRRSIGTGSTKAI